MNEFAKSILLYKDKMYQLFITENKTLNEIALLLQVNVWTVKEYLHKNMEYISPDHT